MTHVWQLQEAKNKFSAVVERAIQNGPQLITKRGVEAVVVVSYADYRKMTMTQQPLSAFFRQSPLTGVALDLERDDSAARPEPAL
jgi:antitoxin Phd